MLIKSAFLLKNPITQLQEPKHTTYRSLVTQEALTLLTFKLNKSPLTKATTTKDSATK